MVQTPLNDVVVLVTLTFHSFYGSTPTMSFFRDTFEIGSRRDSFPFPSLNFSPSREEVLLDTSSMRWTYFVLPLTVGPTLFSIPLVYYAVGVRL